MPRQCTNCGAELFTRARFCRFCGAPSGELADEDLPTMRMPGEGAVPGAATAPAGRPDTKTISPQPTGPAPIPRHPRPPVPHARSRSPWGWVVILLALLLFGSMFAGVLFVAKRNRASRTPPSPPAATRRASTETTFGDQGAVISPSQTVISRTFSLNENAVFSLTNLNGDIAIKGWDQPNAEVKVIKRGGSERERRAVDIAYSNEPDRLSLRASDSRAGRVSVGYEIMLPREVREIRLSATNGTVKISDITSAINVTLQNGAIELTEIAGSVQTKVASGSTRAEIESVASDGRLEFESLNGNIEVEIGSDVDLDVAAEASTGEVEIDDEFPLTLERRLVGGRATGKIGKGGRPLNIRTFHGTIKLSKR